MIAMDLVANAVSLREGLLAEHAAVGALLDAVIASMRAYGKASEDAWSRFADAFEAHLDAEDALAADVPYERGGRVILQEHRYLRACAKELGAAARQGQLGVDALELFRGVLRAHSRNDDRLLYAWAERELAEDARSAAVAAVTSRLRALGAE